MIKSGGPKIKSSVHAYEDENLPEFTMNLIVSFIIDAFLSSLKLSFPYKRYFTAVWSSTLVRS